MKNTIVLVVVLMLSTALFGADFSGTWMLNKEKSELGEGRGSRMAALKMVVTQSEENIKIETTLQGRDGQERVRTRELTLDGKEVTTSNERGETVSSAKVDGETLLLTTLRKMERNGETFEMTSNQKWTLTAENVLTVNIKSESPRGERELKLVYDKQ